MQRAVSSKKSGDKLVISAIFVFVCLLPSVFLPGGLGAQQPKRIPRIGILDSGTRTSNPVNDNAFLEGLRELGYVEGQNVILEYRYADGDISRLVSLASELVQLKVDVIRTGGTQTTVAARQATSTIPIVVGAAGDLVAAKLVRSLARPGGNVTGSTRMSTDLGGKRIELTKDTVSKVSRIAVVSSTATSLLDRDEFKAMESVAPQLGVKLQLVEVKDPKDFQAGYAAMVREHANAVIILHGSFTLFHRKPLVELAIKNRLPSMCEEPRWSNVGCLMSYGPDVPHLHRRAAVFVDKILKGAKPADLPVEQPTKFEFVINLNTAQKIGLSVPQTVLARVNRVIR
jgi:putative ABC transport system substrate-binding protein